MYRISNRRDNAGETNPKEDKNDRNGAGTFLRRGQSWNIGRSRDNEVERGRGGLSRKVVEFRETGILRTVRCWKDVRWDDTEERGDTDSALFLPFTFPHYC